MLLYEYDAPLTVKASTDREKSTVCPVVLRRVTGVVRIKADIPDNAYNNDIRFDAEIAGQQSGLEVVNGQVVGDVNNILTEKDVTVLVSGHDLAGNLVYQGTATTEVEKKLKNLTVKLKTVATATSVPLIDGFELPLVTDAKQSVLLRANLSSSNTTQNSALKQVQILWGDDKTEEVKLTGSQALLERKHVYARVDERQQADRL